jgi:hypothetical protein
MTKKIAFCFLIYDIINHEEIWNRFFKNVDTEKYSIYIHYKYDKKMKYFEQYKLDNCIETTTKLERKIDVKDSIIINLITQHAIINATK